MEIKQLLLLQYQGLSNRKIADHLGMSRNTVNGYVSLFKGRDEPLETLLSWSEDQLQSQPKYASKNYLAQSLSHQAYLTSSVTLNQIISLFPAMPKFVKMNGTYLKHLNKLSRINFLLPDFQP
jgi:transcriptional regulator with XRE-family HTH domain